MALTPTQTSLCNSMNQQWEGILAPIYAAKQSYQRVLRQIESDLINTVFTPQSQIDSMLDSVKGDARDNMPQDDLAAMNDLKDMMEACDFLGIFSPASAILSGTSGVFDAIGDLVDNAGTSVPEFGIGNLINQLFNMLEGVGIPGGSILKELFEKAEQLIVCLSSICGQDVSAKIAELDQLTTDYNLDNNYEIDLTSVYSGAGMTPGEITGMDTAVNGIKDINGEATSAIDNAVSAVKELTKGGGFF